MARLAAALSSRYAVEREIGRGGMATVFLARDLRYDALVAIKVLHSELSALVANERFSREIRITAGLQHPNVLPVLDSGEADGHAYYVMPFVEGESLADRMRREKQLSITDALRIAQEVARALDFAHSRGFVHRDIKPANILLSHGHAIIADFGIARAMDAARGDRLTETGIALGTALYMSPEQATGDAVDGRADIYATGCVLYEMLVGSAPFVGPTPQSVMARHAVDVPPGIRIVRNTVSPELEAIIAKALAKVPADRFATGEEFARAMERAATQRNEAGYRPATTPARRRLAVVGAAGIAVVALAALAALAFFALPSLRPGAALDRHRITVFPLSVARDFTGSPSVGEDIATLIGHSLDGTGTLRWIDGWRLVAAADPRRSSDGRLDPALTRSLARGQRSGFYVTGRVVPRGDSVDVLLDLVDVATDSIVRQSRATGATADAWRAGLRSVNGILPALVPGATARDLATEWADRAPDAVANFLLGEAAFRRAHTAEALGHYREAVRLDSTFALAAIRGAQAATWEHRESEAAALVQRALMQPMTPRFTHFALGYRAYLEGRPDSATNELRRALAIDPEMATAWMQLGEVYTHLLPVAGRTDTLADAAFDEAMRLDSSAVQGLFHPIESRLRRGRAGDAAPLVARFLAAQPDSSLAVHVRVMNACVAHGVSSVRWREEVAASPLGVLGAAQALAAGGGELPCAEAAYTSIRTFETPDKAATDPAADNRRWTSLVGLTGVLIAEGRQIDAIAHVDSAIARKEGGTSLYLIGAALSPALAQRGAAAAQQLVAQWGEACERCTPDRAWQLNTWRAVPRTSDELRAALEAPAPNTAGNLVWIERLGRGPERLAYAKQLESHGEFKQAIDVADVFDSPASQSYVMYLRASLVLRAALADSAHMSSLADGYAKRLATLK